jgi:hypothetical protein
MWSCNAVLIARTGSREAKQEGAMSYYEVARKVRKQKKLEKYLEEIRTATTELERMLSDGDAK